MKRWGRIRNADFECLSLAGMSLLEGLWGPLSIVQWRVPPEYVCEHVGVNVITMASEEQLTGLGEALVCTLKDRAHSSGPVGLKPSPDSEMIIQSFQC